MTRFMARFLCAILLISTAFSGARSETLYLPEQAESIGEEAFAGDASLESIEIRDSVTSIEDRAFMDCLNLRRILIPDSVSAIGTDILKNCAEDVLILSGPDSPAFDYAVTYSLDYRCGTTYRALLIAQTYPDIPRLTLEGPETDAAAFGNCLKRYPGTAYEMTFVQNLTADEMLAAIRNTLSGAKPQDVSLLFYSGHGLTSRDDTARGALLGADGSSWITADQLRGALDQIPGRKIVIVDACYSGNLLRESRQMSGEEPEYGEDYSTAAFTGSFLSAFQKRSRGLGGADYFVLTSAAQDELSFEENIGGKVRGLFTYVIEMGCGNEAAPADANGNGSITLQELYQYVSRKMLLYEQHVQVYPEGCQWFGLLRRD